MPSLNLMDPVIVDILRDLPRLELTSELLEQARRDIQNAPRTPIPLTLEVLDHTIPGPHGQLRLRLIQPRAKFVAKRPAILHIHGGGYVLGCPEMADEQNFTWAAALNALIVSVDYGLAPEIASPGNLEDCFSALQWLIAEADNLEIAADNLAIAGESAGGGLAAALCLLARDRGLSHIRHMSLLYPMLDDRTCSRNEIHAGEYVWTQQNNIFGWTAHLGHSPGQAPKSIYSVPARARSLRNLPPAFIAIGSVDLFLQENLTFAKRLIKAGNRVELHVYPGVPHGFRFFKAAPFYVRSEADRLFALAGALRPSQARSERA